MSGAQFVDGTTALAAANLNALAPAPSSLISGTTPSTSASLVLTVPAQVVVVNPSTGPAVAVSPGATTLTVAASSDSYIDLSAAGTYTQVAVANGTAPPAVTANTLRMWKVVSSGTAIIAVSLVAPTTLFTGVRQLKSGTQGSAGTLTSLSVVDWPGTPSVSITTASGTSLECRVAISTVVSGAANATATLLFYINVDGTQTLVCAPAAYLNGSGQAAVSVSGLATVAINAGTHTVKVQAQIATGSFTVQPTANGMTILEVLEVA